MSSIKYLLVFVMLTTLASSGFALQCFLCDSENEADCGENFDPVDRTYIDCSAPEVRSFLDLTSASTGCMKMTRKHDDGRLTVLRSCDVTNNNCDVNQSSRDSCYLCTGDLCNGSSSMVPIAATIVTFIAVARIFS